MKNKCWVVKIGSALLTNNGKGIDKGLISQWVEQIVELKSYQIDIVLVSSGSIVEGMKRLGWNDKPSDIHKLQAAAAVGQMGLVQAYEYLFAKHNIHTAQVLLTRDNLLNSKHFENISATLTNLLKFGTVPVINENDTVATEEIKFGDNDTLAALVANFLEAEKLIILTDQHGVFDDDPRKNTDANLIKKIHFNDEKLEKVAGKTGGLHGSGGMYSKVMAAKQAAKSQTTSNIAWGREKEVLTRIYQGEYLGTLIHC
jgi:glutamate 5-kinase